MPELLYLKHLPQCLAHGNHYRFAEHDVLLPFYTVSLRIYHPIFSARSLFFPLQFIKYIPDFMVAQMSVRFSKSHGILFIFLPFIESGHLFFSL